MSTAENKIVGDQSFKPANNTNGQLGSNLLRSWRIVKDHPTDLIIGDVLERRNFVTRYV